MSARAAVFVRGSLLALSLAACGSEPPEIPPPTADAIVSGGWADTLIAVGDGVAAPATCTDVLPECEAGVVSTGTCPANAALGPMDGAFHALPRGGRLEVAFRCGAILEHPSTNGTAPMDFKIWATVPEGAIAQVELSVDGSTYVSYFTLDQSNKSFDLARTNELQFARFIRIVGGDVAGIQIDAIEAL